MASSGASFDNGTSRVIASYTRAKPASASAKAVDLVPSSDAWPRRHLICRREVPTHFDTVHRNQCPDSLEFDAWRRGKLEGELVKVVSAENIVRLFEHLTNTAQQGRVGWVDIGRSAEMVFGILHLASLGIHQAHPVPVRTKISTHSPQASPEQRGEATATYHAL